MCMTYHIFSILPIKHLVNQYGKPTMPHKLATDMEPSVSNLYVLLFQSVVQKATAHVDRKLLNIHHKSQKDFCVIFVVIPQHQKGYLIYVPSTWKIVSSHDILFEETFSSVLA